MELKDTEETLETIELLIPSTTHSFVSQDLQQLQTEEVESDWLPNISPCYIAKPNVLSEIRYPMRRYYNCLIPLPLHCIQKMPVVEKTIEQAPKKKKILIKKVIEKPLTPTERTKSGSVHLLLTKDGLFFQVQRRRKSRDVATPILWFQDTQDKTSGARLPGLEKRPISQKLKARQKPKQQEEKTLSYYSQPLPLARELVYPQAEKTSRYRLMQQIKIQRESALQQIYLGLPGRSIKYAEHTTLLQPSIGCQQLTPTFTVDRPACEIFSVLNGVHSLDTQERKLPVLKQPGFHPYGTDDILDDASKLDHQDPIQKTTIHPPKRMRTLSKEHVVKQLMDLSISRT